MIKNLDKWRGLGGTVQVALNLLRDPASPNSMILILNQGPHYFRAGLEGSSPALAYNPHCESQDSLHFRNLVVSVEWHLAKYYKWIYNLAS